MSRAFLPALSLAALAALGAGCAADPAPQANGYNVELWFEAPSGGLVVGAPAAVTVKRIESSYARCQGGDAVCDPRTTAPIQFVSAACDRDACRVERTESLDGALVLDAVGLAEGPTTLRVRVKELASGTELEDAYPIVVHLPPPSPVRFGPISR
jgi:hypothetical protein